MTDALGDATAGEPSVFSGGCTRLAFVSKQVVEDNLRALRREAFGAGVLIDLSSEAWGHGLVDAARAVTSVGPSTIAVSNVPDGIALRSEGIDSEIVVWNLPATAARDELSASGLSAAASSPHAVGVAVRTGAAHVWLDLGIKRVAGATDRPELEAFARALSAAAQGSVTLCASDARLLHEAAGFFTDRGIEVRGLVSPVGRDVAPIGGYAGIVRIGAEVFGLSETLAPAPVSVRPALSLRAPIIALKDADRDVGVSYGYTYRTSQPTTLALVPVGYGDGVDRSLGNRAQVLLRGQRLTIAGRVAMDAIVLDVGARGAVVGDVVEFFGDPAGGAPSAQDYAELLGISSAAVVAGLTARVMRRWT
ncbi:MAG: alanine racemase [Salinibacterium sp.]|nr:alanine racemase C-terminal domain-containing protein [Salinibacterium sp.]MBF0671164.1 alanine racemase [Salinibacterium sp.]